ncbi:XdhC family protein [Pseudarthrobacter enclensis]|uniref:Xanthine dehydrogenase accessory factor n=1 Tax=Pseudarthrobacter enclensis TaxID=993070 RepID=A0ABT9RPC8_9MICC|nr:XdhC family protein [Pseudarthrobacter enclensis]MDP9887086.1 xanthine dehydrogenase accessory factor [Pseudarthrobacter enclensis]
MLDLIPSLGPWVLRLEGRRFAVATVVGASGSVPRPVGTSMLVTQSGDVLGSLSGGCVEGAVVALAQEAMDDDVPRHGIFGFSSADAFAAGLSCGGELAIDIQPVPADAAHPLRTALLQLAGLDPDQPVALVRGLGSLGGTAVVLPHPEAFRLAAEPKLASLLGGEPALQVESLVRSGGAGLVQLPQPGQCASDRSGGQLAGPAILVESRLAPPRMLVFGANDFGAALVPAAKLLGYHVTLVDARPAFTAQPRFAAADQVVTDWPHRYLAAEAAGGRTDSRTVAAVLTHDPKFDVPLLETALALDLAYVGAMGSRRSHLQRVDELLNAGVPAERIARLHSPIGLDLGAITPAEVAVSVTAELIATRNRAASCLPLRDTTGTIHHSAPATAPQDLKTTDFITQEIAWT